MSASVSTLTDGASSAAEPAALPGFVDGTLLTQVCDWWEEAEWSSQEERRLSQRDRDYIDHYQWTADEIAELNRRHQPPLVINRACRKINYCRGFERRLRSDPKAFPRTPSENDNADVATQVLRFVADNNAFDQVRSSVWDNMLIEGYGGAEVIIENGPGDAVDIRAHHVPWDRLWRDPHSSRQNFTDARYMGTVIWMDGDEAASAYPGRGDALEATFSAQMIGSYADKPECQRWTDSARKRVRVVQCHWRQSGDWYTATYTRGGWLADPVKSPYLDRRGNTCSPLRMRSAFVDRNNRRYGVVRELVSMQDELNKRRSKALHRLTVNRIIMEDGAVEDVDKARREAAKPDGVIVVNPGFRFEIDRDTAGLSGEVELLRHITSEIEATGPNAAMTGKDPREQSGRAIQAQQQGGAIELEPLIDGLRQWDREIYEAFWMRARQFMPAATWIRVTDDDRNIKWVGLNRPVTLADELGQMPPDQRAVAMQQLQLQPNDPRLQQVIRTENDISDLDVDITVEDGPDISTLQSEQFNQITQMIQAGIVLPPKAIILASALRPQVKEQLIQALDEQAQQAAQGNEATKQLAEELAKARIAATQAQAAASDAKAKDTAAQTLERVHGMAVEHAHARLTPAAAVVPQPAVIGTPADAAAASTSPGPDPGPAPAVPQPIPFGNPLS